MLAVSMFETAWMVYSRRDETCLIRGCLWMGPTLVQSTWFSEFIRFMKDVKYLREREGGRGRERGREREGEKEREKKDGKIKPKE